MSRLNRHSQMVWTIAQTNKMNELEKIVLLTKLVIYFILTGLPIFTRSKWKEKRKSLNLNF